MQQQDQFMLFTRQEFHAWIWSTLFNRQIKLIQQHHTWSPNYSNFNGSNHFSLLEGMRNYHVNSAGFSDIAQHVTIFPDGLIGIGRSFEKDPAGIAGINGGAICIENIGNFDNGADIMFEEHKKSIIYVTAVLCMRFQLEPSTLTITYHHWWNLDGYRFTDDQINNGNVFNVKTCPGETFFGGNTVDNFNNYFIPAIKHQIDIETGMVVPDEEIQNTDENTTQEQPQPIEETKQDYDSPGMKYLYDNGYIKSSYSKDELMTMETFGLIMQNKGW
jgi:hypothetical protein